MIDAAGDALRLLGDRSPFVLPAFFALGAFTGVGPCVAPRYIALAALVARTRRPWRVAAAFSSGVVSAYVIIGLGAGLLGTVRAWSSLIDVGLALTLTIAGSITLLRDDVHRHTPCGNASSGGAFLLGATSALVVSPCCTPIVAAIAGFAGLDGQPLEAALLVGAFAAGHALPLGAVTFGARSLHALSRLGSASAGAVVGGTLMIALGGFYALRA